MSNERFPVDLVVTVDDFRNSGWRETIKNAGEHGYSSYWHSFSNATRKAIETENTGKGKVLCLLADACSMMLKPKSINEPFQPMMVMEGKRSAIPENFSESDLSFFEDILPELEDYRLKARIADILWLVKQPRNFQNALIAIDTYQLFPLNMESLLRDGREAWERAIKLSLILQRGAGDRIRNICDSIFSKFQDADYSKNLHALWLSDLLAIAYINKNKSTDIIAKLEAFAENAKGAQEWHFAREYYEGAIRWCQVASNEQDIHRLHIEIAETWVSEAERRTSGDNPSNMVAGHFLECAIKNYRKVPRKERATYKINERIDELHKKMNHANKLALDEMGVLEVPGVDISQNINASRNHIAGRNFPDVLLAFAHIASGVEVENILKDAKHDVQKYPLRQLFGSTHMTRDGRVAARSPGISFDADSPEAQQAIWHDMIQHYGLHIGFVVQANIMPALQIINTEHRLTEGMLTSLCQQSHVIPPGREELWGKGLFFGFERDFIVSTHLLIPQVEHLVRLSMKQKGIKTTTLDSNGIETENGLSTLLNNPDIKKALDKNLGFEFKALLTDSIGPNLRNEVAHGLLEAYEGMSVYSIYLWWLCLRIVINFIPWERPNNTKENENCT